MNWNKALMEAMRNGGISELAEKARQQSRAENIGERFDYKVVQAEGRQPGEDMEEAA